MASRYASLTKLANDLLASGPHKQEVTPRRVRTLFNHVFVADTTSANQVWEHPYYPQYYLPTKAIKDDVLEKGKSVDAAGSAFLMTLRVGSRATDRVLMFEKGPLAGLVRLEFGAMDSWFEEDQEIYVHPKDPYKRIDILPSTRTITVKVDGHLLAESSAALFLQETMLPMRYYLPKTSLNWDLITPSATTSRCPYKGEANYYHATVDGKEYKDLFWWYRYPTPESVAIAGKVAPYNEKVEIFIDGVLQRGGST
ncbi:MAG: hypothetical protein M1826_001328 [Phylliscum demangeonii]|nr:MAG: hypothetical protein M1826_001328 [Phylliscum demangeonii]